MSDFKISDSPMTETLVQEVQEMTENLYDFELGVDLRDFIFTDNATDDFRPFLDESQRQLTQFACLFLLPDQGILNMAIYLSDRILDILQFNDPRKKLNDENITETMALVEELTHAMHASLRFLEGDTDVVSDTEITNLELQAKLDTYELLRQLIVRSTGREELYSLDRLWLRYHVFEKQNFENPDEKINKRYRLANDLGHRCVIFLDDLPSDERANELRCLRNLSFYAKKQYIEMVTN